MKEKGLFNLDTLSLDGCRIPKLNVHGSTYYGDAKCTTIGIEMCFNKAGNIEESTNQI